MKALFCLLEIPFLPVNRKFSRSADIIFVLENLRIMKSKVYLFEKYNKLTCWLICVELIYIPFLILP
jgi:hypothetical protein